MNPLKNLIFLTTKLAYFWENLSFFLPFWLGVTLFCLGLIYLLLKSSKNKKFKIIGFNLLLFIILVNTIIFIGEVYFRFIFDYSDTLGNLKTSQRWLDRHVTYNADFFRDRNFSTNKPPGTLRIAVLGDSFAFGWGVETNERFSNLLEGKLNQGSSGRFEVYNTSVPGWESKDELEFLEKRAGLWHFDVVILSYFLNDIYKDKALAIEFTSPAFDNFRQHSIFTPFLEKSYFLEFFLVHLFNFSNVVSYDINQREMTLYRDGPSWKNHEETLGKIVNHCQKNQQKLIVVIFPYLDLVTQDPYSAAFVHQKVKDFFEARSVKVIDLYPVLEDYPLEKLRVNPFDMHPSPKVHQLIAELLYQELTKPSFIDKR